jgi:uncharacterized glyoxalase superfamily metalloenzyme YdcJ
MSEPAGPSVAALQARQTALASQHDTASDADRALAEVLASAHAAMRESVRRLDAIGDEIDRALHDRARLAADTPVGEREFQKFLVAKLREISAVVADARELGRAKKVVLDSLRARYAGSGG